MAEFLERKEYIVPIVVLCFAVVFLPYFFNIPALQKFSEELVMVVSVVNAMAILIALYVQVRRSMMLINERQKGWYYQVWLLFMLVVLSFLGLVYGQSSTQAMWLQYAFLMPAGSVQYSILTFYMASAGARAFRARSPQATLLIVAGIIVLLGQAPLTGAYVPFVEGGRLFLIEGFAKATAKMFAISVTVGAIVLGARTLLGKEEEALGFVGGE